MKGTHDDTIICFFLLCHLKCEVSFNPIDLVKISAVRIVPLQKTNKVGPVVRETCSRGILRDDLLQMFTLFDFDTCLMNSVRHDLKRLNTEYIIIIN